MPNSLGSNHNLVKPSWQGNSNRNVSGAGEPKKIISVVSNAHGPQSNQQSRTRMNGQQLTGMN